MIHHNFELFHDICNTTNEHNQRETHYFSSITNCFDICFYINQKAKSSFIASSASLIMISMLSLFEFITRSSSLSMEEIYLFATVS